MAQLQTISIETGRTARPVVSEANSRLLAELAKARERAEPGQNCAYNQNRECFVGLQVMAGDFSLAGLKDWLRTLTPNSGTGVWMVPFRGIVAADVSAPLDLLYLNDEGKVLDAVEFFPTFRVSPSSPAAASVLALPSHSIFASQTQRGDRLSICSLDEMQWRLEQAAQQGITPENVRLQPAALPGSASPASASGPVLFRDEPKRSIGPTLVRDDARQPMAPTRAFEPAPRFAQPMVPVEAVPVLSAPVAPVAGATIPTLDGNVAVAQVAPVQPATPVAPPAAAKPEPTQKGWFKKLLFPEPSDPRRNSQRQAVSSLVAHFFTGGAPVAHEVRDVSPTGLYVVTSERWYPGTIIRMTLMRQDGGEHPTERSITVHAQSMRWGNDGVGLQFVVEPRKSKSAPQGFADQEQLTAFLKRLK